MLIQQKEEPVPKLTQSLYQRIKLDINRALSQFSLEIQKDTYEQVKIKQSVCEFFTFIEHKKRAQQRGENNLIRDEKFETFAHIDQNLFFPDRLWEFSFSYNFIQRIKNLGDEDFAKTLALMKLILSGYFNPLQNNSVLNCHQSYFGSIKFPFQYDYQCQFTHKKGPLISFQVFPRKYPQFKESEDFPHSFVFIHEITFIAIKFEASNKKDDSSYQNDLNSYIKHQQNLPNFFTDQKVIKEINYPKSNNQILRVGQKTNNQYQLIGPKQFVQINCKNQRFIYNQQINRWMEEQELESFYKKIVRVKEIQDNLYLIKKYCQLPSSQQLLTIISKIPNFKVQLTQEQQKTITRDGDAIVIGRSGTGKTTCAILKLFATDILFKLRVKLDQIKYSTSDLQLNEIDNNQKLKTVFVTASPLLACQVKRLYDKLVTSIQNSINQKRRQKSNIQKENEQFVYPNEQQEDLEKSTFQIIEAMQETEEQNQNTDKQDDFNDLDDDEINQFEKEMGTFTKLTEISKYPVFFTLRKLIALIDSSLINPYFKNQGSVNKVSQWHSEQFGQMRLDDQKQSTYFNEENIRQRINLIDQSDFISVNLQEVTQEVFQRVFWPQIIKIMAGRQKNVSVLDPSLVWAEICSKIKGHETSHEYPDKYMNYDNYYYYHRVLSDIHSQLLFESFEVYEELKKEFCYYDLLDVVNHINYELNQGNDVIETIHYLILDELQDVPRAVLILLQRLTEFGLFCCGDNAQNIAKGIGYKFFEVQNCLLTQRAKLKKNQFKDVKMFDLNINFRSHNQILQLANSVIKILEIFFPYKIDKLNKETSNLIGPKPIVIQSDDPQDLMNYIQEFFTNETKVVEFGCNQAILVKDQDSKTKLPQELQNALVLTIYEAKGLEFDDVVLYNFFTDCQSTQEEWRILQELEVRKQYIRYQEFINYQTIHSTDIIGTTTNSEKDLIEINQIQLRNITQKTNKKQYSLDSFVEFSTLCQDLKQLYVAITRPKKKLIIFDENLRKRYEIQNIWKSLDSIEIIEKKQIQIPQTQFIISQQLNSQSNWKKQGYRMFRLNNYDQAAKCFNFAGDELMAKKCKAYFLATKTNLMNQSTTHYLEAAKLFEEIDLPLRAAQCYFSAKDYQNAYKNYVKTNLKNEIAESAYFAGLYDTAAEIFIELKEIRRVIECYRKSNNWDKIIQVLNLFKDDFSTDERIAFLNKFFPKFLQQMTEEIEVQDKLLEEQDCDNNKVLEESESFCVQNSMSEVNQSLQQEQIIEKQQNLSQENIIELDDSQSFQVENQEQSFDHLTFYDPDDEWLQNDKKSLIKSIASSSVQSQFSNILLMNQPSNVSLLKSRTNIFIKNNVLQQLIQKFILFSNEFQQHLEVRKNKHMMLSNRNEEDREFDHMINFLYDLENIDIDTIYLLLDQLEQFKSYKLCIYVCNQFKLANHLGRYLISLASQYTPLTRNKISIDQTMIGNNLKRKNLLDQAAVAQIALNNILESINPIFTQFKFEEQLHPLNSLGLDCYKELIGLGFWKSVIYQLDLQNALTLCQSFGDYEEIINIFDKIKVQRQTNQLSEQELFQYQKYQYLFQVNQCLKGIKVNFMNQFKKTNEYFMNKKKIDPKTISVLLENAYLSHTKLSFDQQLNQLESCILTYLYLQNGFDSQNISTYDLINIIELQIKLHNKIAKFITEENILDIIQFIYKFSLPKGQIMDHYSQYTLIHVTSGLCNYVTKTSNDKKKQQTQVQQSNIYSNRFIDIGYEYLLASFQNTIKGIYHLFSKLLAKIYFEKSKDLNAYFVNFNFQGYYLNTFDKISQDIENLTTLNFIESSQKFILSNLIGKNFSSIKFKLAQQEIEKQQQPDQEDQQVSILQFLNSGSKKELNRILQITNIRLQNIDNKLKLQLIQESCNLFQKAKNESNDQHAQIILALNLLHSCGNIPLAIFTINQFKGIQTDCYLKYLEFLECQEHNIIEDQFGCFIEFYYELENHLYQDEKIHHLIRIGMMLLFSTVSNKQQFTLKIPQLFIPYMKNIQGYENQSINIPIFELENWNIFEEFIEILGVYLENCEDQQHTYYANLLLLTIFINVFNVQNITNPLKTIVEYNQRQNFYSEILNNLTKNYQIRQDKFIKNNQFILSNYSQEKIIILKINNTAKQNDLEQIYNNCLQKWSNYQLQAEKLKQNGIKLIKLWRQKRQKYYIIQNSKLSQFYCTVKFSYFYQLKKFQLLKIVEYGSKQYEEALEKGFILQDNLLQYFNQPLDSIDLHFCSQHLNKLSSLLINSFNNLQFQQQLKTLENEFQIWIENNVSQKTLEQELLERNQQILAIKWKNLKSGIKVKKLQGQQIQPKVEIETIEEEDEEI